MGNRPGGLTALAVINFLLSANSFLGTLTFAVAFFVAEASAEFEKEGITQSLIVLLAAQGLIDGVLLLISGIGFLGQKRVLGRLVGNLYAVLGLALATTAVVMVPTIKMNMLIGYVYPLIVLFLINVTFRHDLVN